MSENTPLKSSGRFGLARRFAPHGLAAVGVAAALALTACGTTDVDDDSDETDGSGDAGPVTVTDYTGEEITLDAPAERVVTLEWAPTENVEMLGGELVGVADVDGYNAWVGSAEVDEGVTDVGLRTEPSLEAIGQADPDLILGVEESVPDGLKEDLEEIAPVVLQSSGDTADPIEHMRENFFMTAELLAAEEEAEAVWSDYEAAVEESREAVAEAGAEETPFVLTYPTVEGNTATFRMHGPGALAMTLGEEIGLVPAWEDEGDEAFAISQSDVEGLTELPDDTVFYWWTVEGEPEDPFEPLEDNSVWTSLGFVENQAMHPVEQVWIYGGPASAIQWLEYLTETIDE